MSEQCFVFRDDGNDRTMLRRVPDPSRDREVMLASRKVVLNGESIFLVRKDGDWSLVGSADDGTEGFIQTKYLRGASQAKDLTDSHEGSSCAALERETALASAPKGEAVLVNHGSFNPPHRGHLQMMMAARRRVEVAGYHVVAGILGITNMLHIHWKGSPALRDDVRVECIDLLAQEIGEQWIYADVRGVSYGSSSQMIRHLVFDEFPSAMVFSVIGGDVAERYHWSSGRRAVVVIGREGAPVPPEGPGPRLVVAIDQETGDFSSTRVRKALDGGHVDALEALVGAKVSARLLNASADTWVPPSSEPSWR